MRMVFVPGLQGDKSDFRTAKDMATELTGSFGAVQRASSRAQYVTYQKKGSHSDRFPTLSHMGRNAWFSFVNEYCEVNSEEKLWVASSVGAVVALQAMMFGRAAHDIVLFKPVYDVLALVNEIAKMTGQSEKLASLMREPGEIVSLPVSSTDVGGDAGVFKIGQEHLLDSDALKFMTHTGPSVSRLGIAFNKQKIGRMKIIVAENDPLSSPAMALSFSRMIQDLVATPIEIAVLPGDHGTDHSAELETHLRQAVADGWGAPLMKPVIG